MITLYSSVKSIISTFKDSRGYTVNSYITRYNPTEFTLTAYLRLNKSEHKRITKLIKN